MSTIRLPKWSVARRATMLAPLLLLAGCYERSTKGGAGVYSAATWAVLATLVGGLLSVPIGLALRKTSTRVMVIGLIAGPLLLLVLLPSLLMDHATVDARHFEGRYGFWFSPTRYDVQFADLDRIELVSWEERKRRGGTRTKQRLDCHAKSGGVTSVHVGDLLKHARDEILTNATAAGVKVTQGEE